MMLARKPAITALHLAATILVVGATTTSVSAQEQGVNLQAVEMIKNMGYRFTEKGLLNSQGQVVDPESFNRGQAELYKSPTAGLPAAGGASSSNYGNYSNSGNRGNYSNYGSSGGSASSAAGTSEVPLVQGGGSNGNSAVASAGGSQPVIGPSVEMITGGAGADGAARVGRLPILD